MFTCLGWFWFRSFGSFRCLTRVSQVSNFRQNPDKKFVKHYRNKSFLKVFFLFNIKSLYNIHASRITSSHKDRNMLTKVLLYANSNELCTQRTKISNACYGEQYNGFIAFYYVYNVR